MLGFTIVTCLLTTGIALIAGYSVGHDRGLGKPRPQSHFKPGTVYAPFSSTTLAAPRAGGGYDERRLSLLRDEDGAIIYADLEEQLPDGKKVVAYDNNGKIRFRGFNPESPAEKPKETPLVDVLV